MRLSVALPHDLLALSDMASLGRAALQALDQALDDGVCPKAPDASARAATIYVSTGLESRLLGAAQKGASLADTAAGLLHAWALARRADRVEPEDDPLDGAIDGVAGFALRDQQLTMLRQVLPALARGRIAFQEASTGVGKSRVLALLARARAGAGEVVTIATPTVALMVQLLDEFKVLGLPTPAIYLGRAHFVDPLLIDDALTDPDIDIPTAERKALADWDGTPRLGGMTTRLVAHAPDLRWLRDDFAAIAPSVVPSLVVSRQGEHESYDALRAAWLSAPIRITTHAFVAADIRLAVFGQPMVAGYDCLLVDEAHLFEDAVSAAFSNALSLFSLRSRLRDMGSEPANLKRKRLYAPAKRLAGRLLEMIQSLSSSAPAGTYLIAGSADARSVHDTRILETLKGACNAIKGDLQRLSKATIEGASAFGDALEACQSILRNDPVMLQLSPVRRYPSIVSGPRGLGPFLRPFWDRVGCAVLTSGTLVLETAEHGISSGFFSRRLHVPPPRISDLAVITVPWLLSSPEVLVPPLAVAETLIPPRSSDSSGPEAPAPGDDEYYEALARVVAEAAATAVGGTLVLCTSYRAVRLLAKALSFIADRLLVQTPGAFLAFDIAFRRRAAAGERPVWVATGTAWTGLDLRDRAVPAGEDRLLTDVVITRLPIRRAGGLHDELRYQQAGLSIARLDTAFRFRQGIGRLMRAEGQPDRRLWICDGRMWSKTRPYPYLCSPSKRALSRYPNVYTFSPRE